MDVTLMWTLGALTVIVVAGAVWYELRRSRSEALRMRFGPEYDHTVHTAGDVRRAEASLAARVRHVEQLSIRPLSPDAATQYANAWRRVQARFVDSPADAVTEADRLVGEVMHARGYPLGDFEQRVADISVDHPDVVMNYRATRDIAQLHGRGQASTEDLRQAMVHYRALFDDLLETGSLERHGHADTNIPAMKVRS